MNFSFWNARTFRFADYTYDAVLQSFHILNNFDIPIGIEHAAGHAPMIPSATQWTSAIDLTNRKVYYRTAYNSNIRCIDMKQIDFSKVKYQAFPLDKELVQPIEEIIVKWEAKNKSYLFRKKSLGNVCKFKNKPYLCTRNSEE